MRIARKPREFRDVDVTSFADLAFLLIIFFILTTTFSKSMGVSVMIPASSQDEAQKPDEEYPTVAVGPDTLQFRDETLTMEAFREALKKMNLKARPESERVLIVECAPEVTYDRYYQVVTAIAHEGGILALVESVESGESGKGGETAPPAVGGRGL